jgi:hypothetical protein
MNKLYAVTNKAAQNAVNEDGRWLMGVSAIVADNRDPEKQHRVRVIIPSIDEDQVFDEWARQMVFCLGDGFGSAFIPPKGSEVVLFGQLGQKFNLFYASLYNEEMLMPEGYPDEMTVGVHAPGNLKFIAEELAKVQAKNIELIAAQVAKILAANIEATAEQKVTINGQNIEAVAQALAKLKGGSATVEATGTTLLKGNQTNVQGATISINGSGSISIQGGSVAINGSNVTIRGRTVNPSGPPI